MVAEIGDDGGHGVLFVLDARFQYLQEWVGIVVDLPLFEAAAVVPAGVMFDRHRWVACLQQHEIEQLAPGAPISVGEGVDVLEERMESGGFQYGMRRRGAERLNERFDILVYLQRIRRLHCGRGDACDVAIWPELSAHDRLRIQCGDFMQTLDQIHVQGCVFLCPAAHVIHAVANAFGCEDVSGRPIGRDEFSFEYQLGVQQSER